VVRKSVPLVVGCVALCVAMVGCGGDSSPSAPTPSSTSTPAPAARTLSSLGVSASSTTVEVGTTTTVTATATYSDGATNTVTPSWASSNTGVATVSSSGTVTAVAAGSATITATYEGQSGSVALTVSEVTVTETFEFDPLPPSDIMEGDTGHFRVNITRNGTSERIVDGVTSSAPTVLTLKLEGDRWRYTGTGPGTAEIRVVYGDSRRLTHAVRVEERPTPWSSAGSGATIIDLPTRITRIRITGTYNGSSENFTVWCGIPSDRGGLLVNEILGTRSYTSGTTYSGIHSALRSYGGTGQPCRELQVKYASGVQWSITETAPRSGLSETAPRSGLSPAATTGSLADDVAAEQRLRRQVETARRQR
jgi:hypothetical protein